MNEETLASVGAVYTCCKDVRFVTSAVKFDELKVYSSLLNRLSSRLGESAEDEFWLGLLRPLRYFWLDACSAPLAQEDLGNRIALLEQALRSCQSRAASSYPEMMRFVDGLATHLGRMRGSKLDHLLDKLVDIAPQGQKESVAILVKRSQLIGRVEAALQTRSDLAGCRVVGLDSLRGSQCYDRLVVFGRPSWYPEYVFSAPRALEICVVKYEWLQGAWKAQAAFPDDARIPGRPPPEHEVPEVAGSGDGLDIEGLIPAPRWGAIAARLQREVASVSPQETVTARGYMLEDDWIVFLEDEPDASVLLIDPGEIPERRVRRVELGEVEPGMFILLRTAGGGDYVLPVADRIMGDRAQSARQRQRDWKGLLRDQVQRKGMKRVIRELRALGSLIARPVNIRNWMSYRNIGTHANRDFVAIMQLLGLGAEAGEYWATMEDIHDAHRRAGHLIREMLLQQVDKADLADITRKGIMEFELPDNDAGSLTAFRVSSIAHETTEVVHYRIGEPIPPEAG